MEHNIEILIRSENETLPEYASDAASGADVRASIQAPLTIAPGATALVPTGLFFEIPVGYEIQVRPRSGLALKSSITVLNTPGTIDADYRGEVKVILINHGKESFIVQPQMRIAQLVAAPVVQVRFVRLEEGEALSTSARGAGGFGHTGVL